VKALDTNILVYAHRQEAPRNEVASALLARFCESRDAWAIPWPCIAEFYSVVTNRRIWKEAASTPSQALAQLSAWCASPSLMLLSEVPSSLEVLVSILQKTQVQGPAVHDARIVSICIAHGIEMLLTTDRDFSRFTGLRYETPW
jgi:uncharacterized protein